jgi:hypothetical protein
MRPLSYVLRRSRHRWRRVQSISGGSGLNPDVRARARRYGQRLSVLQRVRLAFCFSGKVAVRAVQDMPVLREKLPDPSRLVITSSDEARENAS